MKNFLKTGLMLFVFAFAGILFQIACSNSEDSQSPANIQQEGKLIYTKMTSPVSIWTCNYDGTGETQIPVSLPANFVISTSSFSAHPRVSPDGQNVFFCAIDNSTFTQGIYGCNIDGSNPHQVTAFTPTQVEIGNAY
ncbi:MAG: hypothetical protein EOO48_10500 [Flavobacterium sp.]|nr:MAG: hypothetical protein EOO48_10500 [Flavobacterium sp.]